MENHTHELNIEELELLIESLDDYKPSFKNEIKAGLKLFSESLTTDEEPEVFAKRLNKLKQDGIDGIEFQKENAALLRAKLIQIRRDLKGSNLLKTVINKD